MDSLLCDKPCAKCFTHLVSFNPPQQPHLQSRKQQPSNTEYLAQGHTAQIWCGSQIQTWQNPHTHFSPLQEAAGWGMTEVREDLAALDTNV